MDVISYVLVFFLLQGLVIYVDEVLTVPGITVLVSNAT